MSKFETRLGADEDEYADQLNEIRRGRAVWVVLSGKICSGKDSVAAHLELPGGKQIVSYGDILRGSLHNAMLALLAARDGGESIPNQIALLQKMLKMTDLQAGELLPMMLKEWELDRNCDPWDRTDGLRSILQNLGSVWLPDADHLPASAAPVVMGWISDGNSVVSAGSRFLPDVEIPSLAGAITIRLDVTRETQLRRLKSRDGLDVTPALMESLDHPGETALDDYQFDIRVDNNDDGPGAFEALMQEIQCQVKIILNQRRGFFDEDFGSVAIVGDQPTGING